MATGNGTVDPGQLLSFVEAEFFHSLGSYEKAKEVLEEAGLSERQKKVKDRTRALAEIGHLAFELNESLERKRDDPRSSARHPDPPNAMELASGWAPRIDRFYRAGEKALEYLLEVKGSPDPALLKLGECLYWEQDPSSSAAETNKEFQRYRELIGEAKHEQLAACDLRYVERRAKAKQARYGHRRAGVRAVFPLDDLDEGFKATSSYAQLLLDAHLAGDGEEHERSALFVLDCLTAAHSRLHRAEHFLAQPFKKAVEMHEGGRGHAKQLVREAEALHTFVFVACRSFPWIFARDEGERDAVLNSRAMGPGEHDPPRRNPAEQVARRLSLLALNRRAFGHALVDRLDQGSSNERAFKDFHKLLQLLRVERRTIAFEDEPESDDRSALSERAFIDGLNALAETHIGELYRSDHAHPLALRHFCDAHDRLDLLSRGLSGGSGSEQATAGLLDEDKEKDMAPWLRESRWRIRLLMSKGKGFYEVGNLKGSVKWLVRSWRAFLYLHSGADASGDAEAKNACTRLSEALEAIRNDPDFSKPSMERLLADVIRSAQAVEVKQELRVLAAEILLRLGHTTFVMQLGGEESGPHARNVLAAECLEKALELDRSNVLIDADLLKIGLQWREGKLQPGVDLAERTRSARESEKQWPYGRGEAEQTIRMIEYLMLRMLDASSPVQSSAAGEPRVSVEGAIARALIRQFLTHTDSINVKQSQVYRYLMRRRRDDEADATGQVSGAAHRPPSIEFICLRRYSSFFPFVPRPSAFRALGGGYLVRLHNTRDFPGRSYGIAIDPGPDFIGNLYRCGFSLSDIDMVVVTHDHADHAASLDPLLSLLGYRLRFGDKKYAGPRRSGEEAAKGLRGPKAYGPARRLLIVGNESVARRLDFFNAPHMSSKLVPRPDAVRVMSFDEFSTFQVASESAPARKHAEFEVPRDLRLTPVLSTRHYDGYGFLSYGMRIALKGRNGEDGPSIGFTSDTGGFELRRTEETPKNVPPEEAGQGKWEVEFDEREKAGLKRLDAKSWREHWEDVLGADVLVAHMSATPLTQLQAMVEGDIDETGDVWEAFESSRKKFLETWDGISEDVKNSVNFAFWLTDSNRNTTRPLDNVRADFRWPSDHLYFGGLLEFARAFADAREGYEERRPGLFLVGELREELGTFRSKIALNLDEHIFGERDEADGPQSCRALTADVGLRVLIESDPDELDKSTVRVLCSTCDLDNDRPEGERFHHPSQTQEICVKGENEGIFYNCLSHDPSRHGDQVFLERIERYDIFAVELFR